MIDYYSKYLKYKNKYLHLKQLGGAPPEWLLSFINNLFEVVPKLNSQFISSDEYPPTFWKLAGSAGTVLLAYTLNPELLNSLYEPGDIDIITFTPSGEHIPVIAGRPAINSEVSTTYTKDSLISIDTINSFPTSRTPYTKYINVIITHPITGESLNIPVDTVSSIYSDYLNNPIMTDNYNKKIDFLKTISNDNFTINEIKFREPRTIIDDSIARALF